jgi:hypothetical protein
VIVNIRSDRDLRRLNRRLKYDVWCFRQCVVVGHFRLENDFIDGLFDDVMGLELVDDHHRCFSWYLCLDLFGNFLFPLLCCLRVVLRCIDCCLC